MKQRCNILQILATASCLAIKHLQGVNIFQQSVTRHRITGTRASLEKHISSWWMWTLFFESITVTHAFVSALSINAWKCYIKSSLLLTFPILSMCSQGPAGNEFCIPLMRPLPSPLRRRHKPTATKEMHSKTSHACSVQASAAQTAAEVSGPGATQWRKEAGCRSWLVCGLQRWI